MNVEQALQLLKETGLAAEFIARTQTIMGGSDIEVVEIINGISYKNYSEPFFWITQTETDWIASIDNLDSKLGDMLSRHTFSLSEAIEFICAIASKWRHIWESESSP